jgi:sugar phosphate isomerase/epimerase
MAVADQVLLSASPNNIEACVQLASEHDLGIELMAFALPAVLDGSWQALVDSYRALLAPLRGPRALHGPFFDMAPGSLDAQINALCSARFRQALDIAAALDARIVVLHANFIASMRNREYRTGWHQRNLAFWPPIGDYAAERGVTIAVENMWEFDPTILSELLAALEHPNIRACIDVGHAHLFSDVPFDDWLGALGPWIVHAHINNNDGIFDVHRPLTEGVLDYTDILPQLRALPQPPTITLEMDSPDDMALSLPFLELTPLSTDR